MKIAFIGQKGIPVKTGGVERRVEELSTNMVKEGHEVFVYARKNYISQNLKTYKGVHIITLPTVSTKHLEAIIHTFFATIHALFCDYDVVHFQAPGPSSLCWIIRIFKPKTVLIATFNSQDYFHKKWGVLARAYLRLGEWIICKVPNKTIVVSDILRKYVLEKYHKEAIVILNGAASEKPEGDYLLKNFNLESGKYFLTVSRLIRHKGIHYLIEAFIKMEKEHKLPENFKLAIVGEGAYTDDYVQELKELAKKSKNIIFTGSQNGEALAELYFHTYLFVQPSESEGLSNALLEAMGYGKAVLISDIPENLSIVKNKGLIFKNKNLIDLQEKMEIAVQNPSLLTLLGNKAYQEAQEKYNWGEIAKQNINVYKKELALKN